MDRNGTILAGLDPNHARILEIGPSFSPIAAKRAGWRTTVVDHTDRDGLVAKYGQFPEIDISTIEEVDYVWTGGLLDTVLPGAEHGSYDTLIASHVIEHIVDPVSFLASADRLLKPNGRIVLAVPDLRLCFDCMRPTSTTGQIIAAWREGRTRHAWGAVFDALAYDARPVDDSPSWGRGASVDPRPKGDLRSIARGLEGYQDRSQSEYLDVHGWTFTPASFLLIMLELHALGLSRWSVARLTECQAVEFLAFLERSEKLLPDDTLARERTRLMVRRWAELREQANWMLAEETPGAASPTEANRLPPDLMYEITRLRETTAALLRLSENI
jgi:SAM-dependent methyltransferase